MTSERSGLTFAQAEGVEPLPSQLALREISPELSATLWATVYESLNDCIRPHPTYSGRFVLFDPWRTILESWWIVRLHKNIDEFPVPLAILQLVKERVTSKDYILVFDFLQFVISRPDCPPGFMKDVEDMLRLGRASYRVIDDTITPITSDEEAKAVTKSLAVAKSAGAQGPRIHLHNAAGALSSGMWANSIKESIHAVEAAAKSIEPSASTLGPALSKLQSTINLNPAVSKAFSALYGYASNEQGVRHSLVFSSEANVNERDALFMFGACASFVGYLLSVSEVSKT